MGEYRVQSAQDTENGRRCDQSHLTLSQDIKQKSSTLQQAPEFAVMGNWHRRNQDQLMISEASKQQWPSHQVNMPNHHTPFQAKPASVMKWSLRIAATSQLSQLYQALSQDTAVSNVHIGYHQKHHDQRLQLYHHQRQQVCHHECNFKCLTARPSRSPISYTTIHGSLQGSSNHVDSIATLSQRLALARQQQVAISQYQLAAQATIIDCTLSSHPHDLPSDQKSNNLGQSPAEAKTSIWFQRELYSMIATQLSHECYYFPVQD